MQDSGGFRKQLGKGKREAKLIMNSEMKETMVYNAKKQILRATFFMDTGIRMGLVRISQQWIEYSNLSTFVLDLINFSKNCDFSKNCEKIGEIAVFANIN